MKLLPTGVAKGFKLRTSHSSESLQIFFRPFLILVQLRMVQRAVHSSAPFLCQPQVVIPIQKMRVTDPLHHSPLTTYLVHTSRLRCSSNAGGLPPFQSIFSGIASEKTLCPPPCGVLTPPHPPKGSVSDLRVARIYTQLRCAWVPCVKTLRPSEGGSGAKHLQRHSVAASALGKGGLPPKPKACTRTV
jgi:hypothetical protein